MSIIDEANKRGISEVLHFTTNSGFLGILAQSQVLPNSKLHQEDTLAFIFKQNSEARKEKNKKWLDYVNLSVSKLNFEFFGYSQYIHRNADMFWVVLSFSIEILEHEGVFFTTTNNIYPSCKRSQGYNGFAAMFSNPIEGKFQAMFYRSDEHLSSWTTCEQAEVLYPEGLSLDYIEKIYVPNEAAKSCVKAQMSLYNKSIETVIDPSVFKR
ncbi:DarT ssDNA thymidine ADP-ribosyltransferase family protein [Photobacterium leiognathi]|uniref:DarT ssDNA thymidine ADP-ribosyltransferase family protein n=1 Tax=Photobacterium leiognathi TaxID=553611 RepID=UPI0029827AC3|nr:DarT ssDNA thymidine ADP-ribosyltransferase family protein [Photobacterium leiognathi]